MSTRVLDLTGQHFGMLRALYRLQKKENGYFLWECVCDCGGRIQVSTKKLQRRTVTNCGCIPKNNACNGTIAEDIKDRQFGLLTAIRRVESKNGKTRWLCICECGGTYIATTSMLKSGKTWHCGCVSGKIKYSPMLDLRNKQFDRLRAVRDTGKRNKKGSVIWECVCECGNVVEVPAERLVSRGNTSCGCKRQEINDAIGEHLTFVDGTCVEWLRSRKSRSDNTSGHRGVYKTRSGKWYAAIGFKREKYHIGSFNTFEEAKAARLDVEKRLHDDFVIAWEKWSAIANDDLCWAKDNPFIFDVFKVDGEIAVHAPILSESIEAT